MYPYLSIGINPGTIPTRETPTPSLQRFSTSIITRLYQIGLGQFDTGALELDRMNIQYYVEVKCGAYNPRSVRSDVPQHLSPLGSRVKLEVAQARMKFQVQSWATDTKR